MTKLPEYKTWQSMKDRCRPESSKINYGPRGIRVCFRWAHSFENFYADMGSKPTSEHTLDRKDVNGNYSPENCRWATIIEQHRNRRDNRMIEWRGSIKTLAQWSEEFKTSRARALTILGQRSDEYRRKRAVAERRRKALKKKGIAMKKTKLKEPVLAEGEQTGHAHVLDANVTVEEREDKAREFKLSKATQVVHEEHKTVTIPPGEFISDVVRETDPFEGERRVQD